MNNGGLILIIGSLLSAAAAFIWLAFKLDSGPKRPASKTKADLAATAENDVEHLFDEEFRQELRNRGRLHFETIIGENAALLQQDLHQTTAQLNDYMRTEINRTLEQEFKKYEHSIAAAQQTAQESMERTVAVIEQQRQAVEEQLKTQIETQKAHIIDAFETQMANIINHYVLQAIGNQIDLTDQLDFILSELETNRAAIIQDIKNGTA